MSYLLTVSSFRSILRIAHSLSPCDANSGGHDKCLHLVGLQRSSGIRPGLHLPRRDRPNLRDSEAYSTECDVSMDKVSQHTQTEDQPYSRTPFIRLLSRQCAVGLLLVRGKHPLVVRQAQPLISRGTTYHERTAPATVVRKSRIA